MSHPILGDRKRSLEEEFFRRQEAELRRRVRAKTERKARREALRDASGISDEAILERLEELGLDAESVAALTLVPLIEVAWADGHLDRREEEAVLAAAGDAGVEPGSPARELLAGWLRSKPESRLSDTWKAYVQALAPTLDDQGRRAIEEAVLGRARRVAGVAGGLLGLARKVSAAEEEVLSELAAAFR